jgi:hypothetical protein
LVAATGRLSTHSSLKAHQQSGTNNNRGKKRGHKSKRRTRKKKRKGNKNKMAKVGTIVKLETLTVLPVKGIVSKLYSISSSMPGSDEEEQESKEGWNEKFDWDDEEEDGKAKKNEPKENWLQDTRVVMKRDGTFMALSKKERLIFIQLSEKKTEIEDIRVIQNHCEEGYRNLT